jgi:hypothetical protein
MGRRARGKQRREGRNAIARLHFAVPDWCKISYGRINFIVETISFAYHSRNVPGLLIPWHGHRMGFRFH